MLLYKYIVKNVASRNGKTVTFMPKPIFGDNGSGMHTHQSLWKAGEPLFSGDGYAGLSQLALWYVGGLIKHGPALSAIIAPTTNSYKRLVPGFEAPINLAYSRRNRSAACRIPMYTIAARSKSGGVSPTGSQLQSLHGIRGDADGRALMGSRTRWIRGRPWTKICTNWTRKKCPTFPRMPGSLEDALDALQRDHDFLLKGEVFTEELLRTYVDYKRSKEVDADSAKAASV